jgi:L-ascorbate metabolism protein UlaG (beta-lactamase superfamily)
MDEILMGMIVFGLAGLFAFAPAPAVAQDLAAFCAAKPGPDDVLVYYMGFSGVVIRTADATVIIDPANFLMPRDIEKLKALGVDLLFFTHGHGDHFVLDTALEIVKATQAYVAAEPGVAAKLRGSVPAGRMLDAAAGKSLSAGKLKLDFVAGQHFGPILLVRIQAGATRIFHGGDSGYVPLSKFPADVAILPAGNPSPTASPQAAFRMASDLKPQAVVAVHGSDAAQTAELEKKVKAGLKDTTTIIPEWGKMVKLTLRRPPA